MVVALNTFLFADLCGYTERSLRYGDDYSAEVAVGFHELVRVLAGEECCELVKGSGDAVMVRAGECEQAVRLARRIHARTTALGYPQVRIGIDTGPAVPAHGDWYGTTVNTAARVTEAAEPGELLMTDRAREAVSESPDVQTVTRGTRPLKGLPKCLLHAAALGHGAAANGA
jgi:adenylate cyclase